MIRTPKVRSGIRRFLKRLGDYKILDRIGQGGMGAVYKARHLHMDRLVAIKVVRPSAQAVETLRRRFEKEIRAAVSLQPIPRIADRIDDKSLAEHVSE